MTLSLYGFRVLFILLYVVAVIVSVLRRERLGTAMLPAVLGFAILCCASSISTLILYWQIHVASSGQEIRDVAYMLGFLTVTAQAMGIAGALLVVIAVFSGRSKVAATPSNRWGGP